MIFLRVRPDRSREDKRASGRGLLALVSGALLFALAAFLGSTPARVEAQASVTSLPALRAIAGEDPRGTYGRLAIPSLGVDAVLGTHAVPADAVLMPNPYGPGDVAWYEFESSAFGGAPGSGRNIVLSGHVNYSATVSYAGLHYRGPGVFARIEELAPGDMVQVVRGGRTYRYMVSWSKSLVGEPTDAWGEAITSRVPIESVTLFTCDGLFDPATLTYSHRYVVRAELLRGDANRLAAPVGDSRYSVGRSGTTHPIALVEAQRWPVVAMYVRDDAAGSWRTYRPGAPAFANTLFGHLREDSVVIAEFAR